MLAPLVSAMGIDGAIGPALVIMVIGAGAMTVSHVNDSFFWIVTEFSGMTMTMILWTVLVQLKK